MSIPSPCLFDNTHTPAIYGIFHTASARVYVGSAVDIKNRWRHHRNDLNGNRHSNAYLQRAWNKYGASAFEFRVLEIVADAKMLVSTEQQWIDKLNAHKSKGGFNIAPMAGNTLGAKRTPEQCRRFAAVKIGRAVPAAKGLVRFSKLTPQIVQEILNRLANGEQQIMLAAEYGLHRVTIGQIANRKSWKNVHVSAEQLACIKSFSYRTARGSQKGGAKLTESCVADIKRRIAAGEMLKDIATRYNVKSCTISQIKSGEHWSHVVSD